MKKMALSAFVITLFIGTPAFAESKIFSSAQMSAAGALVIGTGVLYTLASPLTLATEISNPTCPSCWFEKTM